MLIQHMYTYKICYTLVAPYTTVHRRLPERDEILLTIDRYVVHINHPAILLNPLLKLCFFDWYEFFFLIPLAEFYF